VGTAEPTFDGAGAAGGDLNSPLSPANPATDESQSRRKGRRPQTRFGVDVDRLDRERDRRLWSREELASRARISPRSLAEVYRTEDATASVITGLVRGLNTTEDSSLAAIDVSDISQDLAKEADAADSQGIVYLDDAPQLVDAFCGRDNDLARLDKDFATTTAQPVVRVIAAMGGAGKTQLAVAYALRARARYTHICWFNADSDGSLLASVAGFARQVGLVPLGNSPGPHLFPTTRTWLETRENCLLILDGAPETRMLGPILPRSSTHVIITTQDQTWPGPGTVIRLTLLAPDDGVRLITSRVGLQESEAAASLAAELDYLPLALAQAAAYTRETQISLRDYLTIYATRGAELRRRGRASPDYPHTVATTWSLAFSRIQEQSPATTDFFKVCAYLAPNLIPLDLLETKLPEVPRKIAAILNDPVLLNDAIHLLTRFSLVNRRGSNISIHKLVQAVTLDVLPPIDAANYCVLALVLIQEAFPPPYGQNPSNYSATHWERSSRLLPHADAIIRHVLAKFQQGPWESELGRRTMLLLDALGAYTGGMSSATQSLWYYEMLVAVAAKRPTLGPNEYATALGAFAVSLRTAGQWNRAEQVLRTALTLVDHHDPENGPLLVKLMSHLGDTLLERHNYKEALAYLEQALSLSDHQPNVSALELSFVHSRLGRIHHQLSSHSEARTHYLLALSDARQRGSILDEIQAKTYLGDLHADAKEYVEALECLKGALKLAEAHLPGDHPFRLDIMARMAVCFSAHRRHPEALTLARSLAVATANIPDAEQPRAGSIFRKVARVLVAAGDKAGALDALDHALMAVGDDSDADVQYQISVLLDVQSIEFFACQYDRAARHALRAAELCEREHGADHPRTIQALECAVAGLILQGDYTQAATLARRRFPPHHPLAHANRKALREYASNLRRAVKRAPIPSAW